MFRFIICVAFNQNEWSSSLLLIFAEGSPPTKKNKEGKGKERLLLSL